MNTNNQQIVHGFLSAIMATDRKIPYHANYLDTKLYMDKGEINFMYVITDPTYRVALKAGADAVMVASNDHPKFKHPEYVLLIRGTPYGILVVYGRKDTYSMSNDGSTAFGQMPELHVTGAFMNAAMRYFARQNKEFRLINGTEQLLSWIFSPNFMADIVEQTQIDKTNGIAVGDGLPPKPNWERRQAKASEGVNAGRRNTDRPIQTKGNSKPEQQRNHPQGGKPNYTKMTIHESKGGNPKGGNPAQTRSLQQKTAKKEKPPIGSHPLDILPCRANGFKGTPYSEQAAEQKAEGQKLLSQQSKAEINAGEAAMAAACKETLQDSLPECHPGHVPSYVSAI